MNPVISVILPVYNAEQYIAEAIDSILNQSFSDFELIIIDDGSTDGSLAIIRGYQDGRIRVISRENRGLVATLNEGIGLARGVWLARMD
ncbi:partial heptose III glucuronosyltransferase, partial [Patescibacteria group bacterium]